MIFLFRFQHRTEVRWVDSEAIFPFFSRFLSHVDKHNGNVPINFNYATVLMSLNGL